VYPRALAVDGPPALAPDTRRASPPGTWAAPLPSLTLTGESYRLRPLFAEDGRRAQHDF